MSIAMLLSEAQQNPESLKHHIFDIDEREEIQKLWQEIQRRNRTPPPEPADAAESDSEAPSETSEWTSGEQEFLLDLCDEDMGWEDIAKNLGLRHSIANCQLQYQIQHQKRLSDEKWRNEFYKAKLTAAYER